MSSSSAATPNPSQYAPSISSTGPSTYTGTTLNSSASSRPANLSSTVEKPSDFVYPPHYSFKPFFTLQPNLTTQASQLASWTSFLVAYAAHHRIYRMTTSHPVFTNTRLERRLAPDDVKVLFAYMAERGRVEWVDGPRGKKDAPKDEVWVWWRTAEEWAGLVADWVEETGQRNTVLTLYELTEGEGTRSQPFYGIPMDLLKKALAVLVKRGKASVFGDEDQPGVKIY